MINKFVGVFLLFGLSGCSQQLSDYESVQPKLDLKQFFDGHLVAHGMVQDFKGKMNRRFRADIKGAWQGNRGVLDETFYFADGEVSTRCWRLQKNGDNYTGTAGDVLGQASGKVVGSVLNWSYQLRVPVDDSEYDLWLDDWLYLIDDSLLINKTDMKKWGVTVAQLTLSIRKLANQQAVKLSPNCQLEEV